MFGCHKCGTVGSTEACATLVRPDGVPYVNTACVPVSSSGAVWAHEDQWLDTFFNQRRESSYFGEVEADYVGWWPASI
jgi:hypothetical protein